MAEIRDVLTRPKLMAKFHALMKAAVDAFLAQHLRMATWISDVQEHDTLARDPDDSRYLNLVITAGASYVVTTDLDLLDLMNPQSEAGVDFHQRFPGIQIASPGPFEAHINQAARQSQAVAEACQSAHAEGDCGGSSRGGVCRAGTSRIANTDFGRRSSRKILEPI